MLLNEGNDYHIILDQTVGDIRHVTACPSALVCSRQIDIELKGQTIEKVIYTRGCDGNAQGIGALLRGMSVKEAISRLRGICCGGKPTSCPDQLARILENL